MTKDMVTFLMPDGTEVSNDPEFDAAEARQKVLESREYTGDAGVPVDEQKAQTQVEHEASINSGQGDGPEDPTKDLHGPLGSPAQQRQTDDRYQAQADGGSPQSTTVEDADPVDSNEEVLKVREERKKRSEAAQKALEEAGEEPGDPDKPYSEWNARQLKAEVAKRNAERDDDGQLVIEKGMKKGDVATLLDEDDKRQGNAGGGSEE